MTCKNCGNELKDSAKFCTKCGTPVTEVPNPAIAAETQPIVSPVEMAQPEINPAAAFVQDRADYFGKQYIFDYYIGLNLRSLRLSRRAVVFSDDFLLYCKGLRKKQIPYNMIQEIKDETKISPYVIFYIVLSALIGLICAVLGGWFVMLVAVLLIVLGALAIKYRLITIVTKDNKKFNIKVCQKDKEIDQFLVNLKKEAGIL